MKKSFLKNACFSLAFILFLGLLPGSVMAEENDANNSAATEAGVETPALPAIYSARLAAPGTDNPYFYADNPYYLGGYGMPNCTAYAYGRAYENLGTKPNLSMGNANQWWDYNLSNGYYPSGRTAKLGAIICWGNGAAGHVAVVESIVGDVVTISESSWGGDLFNSYSYISGSEDSTSIGGFQGYIYVGDFIDASSDTIPPVISDLQITEADEAGFTATCQVSDEGTGIDRVYFPVWTDNGDQDDVIWYEGTVVGNTATCRVNYADHNNEFGDYNIHGYVYDQADLNTMTGTSISHDNETFISLADVVLS